MLSFISLFMVVFPNYKFSFLFHTWNIIKSNLVGTIACVPPLAACTRSRFFFSVSPMDTKLYAHPTMSIASMHGNYRSFRTLNVIFRCFASIKPYNSAPMWHNVRIVSEFVHTLPWGPHWPCPRAPKRLGSYHACLHMNHVQAGPFGSAGGQVWKRFSLPVPPNDTKLYAHPTMTMACIWEEKSYTTASFCWNLINSHSYYM